jgi:hypothetical protein
VRSASAAALGAADEVLGLLGGAGIEERRADGGGGRTESGIGAFSDSLSALGGGGGATASSCGAGVGSAGGS